MKILKNVMLVLLMSLAVVSCKKDDDGGDDSQGGSGSLTAKVNGSSFLGSVVAIANEVNAGGSSFITLQGSDASGKAMLLTITAFDGPGTYEISTESTVAHTASYTETNINNPQSSPTWVAPYEDSGMVGEIKVSEKTATTIKGTFNFKGKEQMGTSFREITEGQFNLEFQ